MNTPVYLQASNHAEEHGSYFTHGTAARRKHEPSIYNLRSYYKYKPEWKPVKGETDTRLVYPNAQTGNDELEKFPKKPQLKAFWMPFAAALAARFVWSQVKKGKK